MCFCPTPSRPLALSDDGLPVRRPGLFLFLVSCLALFLELMLIRWISTEVRIFAYLQNTVLVVCFLGLGMGCLTCRASARLRLSLLALATLAMILAWPVTRETAGAISTFLGQLDGLLIWQRGTASSRAEVILSVAAGLAMTFGLMVLLWEVFLPLGRALGRYLEDHPCAIRAYSLNVAGSLAGIALFTGLSAASAPPLAWMATGAAMTLPFLGTGRERTGNLMLLAILLACAAAAGRQPGATKVVWSPYQKLVLTDSRTRGIQRLHTWPGRYLVLVNNAGYQGMIDLSEAAVRANTGIAPARRGLSQYDVPLLLHPRPREVLVVGAGAGNDVAGALRGGAERVTAVEIDPAIIEMGRRYHPEHPYDSEQVTVVNDDARSFFATTEDTFDLVIFGLLDSHTTTSMTNARLDHYVYTRESLEQARSLLKPGGIMSLSFEVAKPYIGRRIGAALGDVFGREPLAFRLPQDEQGWGGVMFVAGDPASLQAGLAGHPRLRGWIERWQEAYRPGSGFVEPTTDDWPYLYLRSRRIPLLYGLLALLMAALAWRCKRRLAMPGAALRWQSADWHFFLLGAAFLLLEVQNISKASVVLGNTWVVNAVIIASILVMILLANLAEAAWSRFLPDRWIVALLLVCCLGLYFLDLSRFAFWAYPAKAALVGGLTTLPMFFGGIVFIRSFASCADKARAMGANMFGALAGGLLQSVTFVVGVKALLLLVAAMYALAAALRAKGSPSWDLAGATPELPAGSSAGTPAVRVPAPTTSRAG